MDEFKYPQQWPPGPGCQTPWSPSQGETASPSAEGADVVATRPGTHSPTRPVLQQSIYLQMEGICSVTMSIKQIYNFC